MSRENDGPKPDELLLRDLGIIVSTDAELKVEFDKLEKDMAEGACRAREISEKQDVLWGKSGRKLRI